MYAFLGALTLKGLMEPGNLKGIELIIVFRMHKLKATNSGRIHPLDTCVPVGIQSNNISKIPPFVEI